MRRSRLSRSVALALLLLLVSACGGNTETEASSPPPTAAGDPLTGTTWTLDTITHPTGNAPVPEMERPTIAFADGQVSGSAGCNTYSGSYSVDGSSLELGPLATTQMACSGDAAVIEVAYMGTLGKVDSFSIDGDTLTLSVGGSSLTYSAGSGASLIGVSWVVVNLATTDALSGTVAGHEPTMEFGQDGSVIGTDGCNTYTADYVLSYGSIEIGPLATTKKACPETDIQQQAADLASAMPEVAKYEVAGGKLTLTSTDGQILTVATSEPTG